MNTPEQQVRAGEASCFVEQFQLRSPIEEFQEAASVELGRLKREGAEIDGATYREAIELVLHKLRPEKVGAAR